jgi:hypothetical protein
MRENSQFPALSHFVGINTNRRNGWLGREDSNFCMVESKSATGHILSKQWVLLRCGVFGVSEEQQLLLRIDWLSCSNGALLW